ncbi:hypothetical protein, partial [Kocuria rhizophila]|uniref:hypothetical protein n=1 Tax=Kocuria rhizophila TaxID=72000 RepID=UPI001C92E3C7
GDRIWGWGGIAVMSGKRLWGMGGRMFEVKERVRGVLEERMGWVIGVWGGKWWKRRRVGGR